MAWSWANIDWNQTVQATLTLLAIAAAVATPYIAASIERRGRRETAVRLAALVYEAIDAVAILHGAAHEQAIEELNRTSYTLKLTTLLDRLETTPSDHLDNAHALDAFIRIGGLGRSCAQASSDMINRTSLTVDQAAELKTRLPEIRDMALEELEKLRTHLR